jgi:hypothetical protein
MSIVEREFPPRALIGRWAASEVFGAFDRHIFPREAKEKIKNLIREGTGVIITANHPSEMDPPKILAMLFADDFFRKTRITAPVGAHQLPKAQLANRVFGAKLDLIPVVNSHTIEKNPNMNSRRGEGLKQYLKASLETLREGGIVLVFFQAGREPTIGTAGENNVVLEGLYRILNRYNIRPAIAFLGVSIPRIDPHAAEYKKALSPYLLQVGNVLTWEELNRQLQTEGQRVDEYAFEQVKELVTPEYR